MYCFVRVGSGLRSVHGSTLMQVAGSVGEDVMMGLQVPFQHLIEELQE
jgi:hypothetical protein